jgi:hypothetical protein
MSSSALPPTTSLLLDRSSSQRSRVAGGDHHAEILVGDSSLGQFSALFVYTAGRGEEQRPEGKPARERRSAESANSVQSLAPATAWPAASTRRRCRRGQRARCARRSRDRQQRARRNFLRRARSKAPRRQVIGPMSARALSGPDPELPYRGENGPSVAGRQSHYCR